jgi:kinesin family protein C2/C3
VLTFQVASLKDTIAKKDEEIERLQLLKDLKSVYPGINGEKRGTVSLRYRSSSPSRESVSRTTQRSQRPLGVKGLGHAEKAASDHESDFHSEADSQQSMDDFKYQNEHVQQSKIAGGEIGQNYPTDAEIFGLGDADYEERLSEISDGDLSVGTDTDGSAENANTSEGTKLSDNSDK